MGMSRLTGLDIVRNFPHYRTMNASEQDAARALGRLLRAAREGLGISQSKIAAEVGVSPTWVRHVEIGEPDRTGGHRPVRPSTHTLVRWARALALDPMDVFAAGGYDTETLKIVEAQTDDGRRRLMLTIGELEPADVEAVEAVVSRLIDRGTSTRDTAGRG